MNRFPSSEKVNMLKERYPEGSRILLENMEDSYAPVPAGTRGTVDFVDDAGQLHMKWDNGRTLAVVPGVDSFRKLTEKEHAAEQRDGKYSYTLHIHRYDRYLQFNSLKELQDELKRYFSPRELASGIVERLTDFKNKNEDGYYRNAFQDFEVCCYENELNVSSEFKFILTARSMWNDNISQRSSFLDEAYYSFEEAQDRCREFQKSLASHMIAGIEEVCFASGSSSVKTGSYWELHRGQFEKKTDVVNKKSPLEDIIESATIRSEVSSKSKETVRVVSEKSEHEF